MSAHNWPAAHDVLVGTLSHHWAVSLVNSLTSAFFIARSQVSDRVSECVRGDVCHCESGPRCPRGIAR
jgi:hypothetical protein